MPASAASVPFSVYPHSQSHTTRLHSLSTSNLLSSITWSDSKHQQQQQREKPHRPEPEQHTKRKSGAAAPLNAGSNPRHTTKREEGRRSSAHPLHPPRIGERDSSLYCAHFAASTASLAFSPELPKPSFYSHTNYTAFELSSNRRSSTFGLDTEAEPYWPSSVSAAPTSSSSSISDHSGSDRTTTKSLRSKWDALLRAAHIGGRKAKRDSNSNKLARRGHLSSRSVYDFRGPSSPSAALEAYLHPQPYGAACEPPTLRYLSSSSGNTSRMSLSSSSSAMGRPTGQILFESPELHDPTDRAMLPPPVKPARSRLRPAAEIIPALRLSGHDHPQLSQASRTGAASSSSSELHLPMRTLAVDPPLAVPEDTPSLSSDSSSEHEHESEQLRSPMLDSITWNTKKKRGYTGADPLKVKDGLSAKTSSSGVYTPSTFPGAQGQQQQQQQQQSSTSPSTSIYTPNTFTLFPVRPNPQPIPGPSRQASISSSLSSESSLTPRTPMTPMTPASARFSTKSAMSGFSSGIKRISSTIHSTTAAVTPTWRSPPGSARESYFPGGHGRDRGARTASWSSMPAGTAAGGGGSFASPELAQSGFVPGPTTASPGLGLSVVSEPHTPAGLLPTPSSPATPRSRVVSAEEKKVKRKQVPKVSDQAGGQGDEEADRDDHGPCHAL